MAIMHMSVKIISRGKGQSAIASAAYRSATKLEDKFYGETKDYSKKRFVEHSEIQLPANAPKEYANRENLWNSVEKAEKNKNAQLAREVEIALPREMTREQQLELVHDYVQKQFVDQGMIADWSLHNPKPDEKQPDRPANPHVHIMLTMRSLKPNGKWAPKKSSHYVLDKDGHKIPVIDPKTGKQKLGARNQKIWKREITPTNDWNNPENVEKWRSEWAKACNKYLSQERQIDHRSYAKQGIYKVPTIHEGYYARKLEREKPGSSELVAKNRKRKAANRWFEAVNKEINKFAETLKEAQKHISAIVQKQFQRLANINAGKEKQVPEKPQPRQLQPQVIRHTVTLHGYEWEQEQEIYYYEPQKKKRPKLVAKNLPEFENKLSDRVPKQRNIKQQLLAGRKANAKEEIYQLVLSRSGYFINPTKADFEKANKDAGLEPAVNLDQIQFKDAPMKIKFNKKKQQKQQEEKQKEQALQKELWRRYNGLER